MHLCICHCEISHDFVLQQEHSPVGQKCATPLTVEHILLECSDFIVNWERYLFRHLMRKLIIFLNSFYFFRPLACATKFSFSVVSCRSVYNLSYILSFWPLCSETVWFLSVHIKLLDCCIKWFCFNIIFFYLRISTKYLPLLTLTSVYTLFITFTLGSLIYFIMT